MGVDVTLNNISSGFNRTKINENFTAIKTALTDALSRSGDGTNTMSADLDMNGFDIINLGSFGLEGGDSLADLVGYAEEWANKAEDSLVSVAAGGNGTTEYSSLHWAAKASASATAAAADADSAADSATIALSAALGWQSVTTLTTGTYNLEVADTRKYYLLDTSGGAITINLPLIGTDEGLLYGFQVVNNSNTVTFVRDGTDTINGSTTYTMTESGQVVNFVADDNTPDNWIATIITQVTAGSGLAKTGSSIAIDYTANGTWTGSHSNTPVTDNDGSFDISARNNFNWTPTGADVIEFTNEAAGKGGLIYLDNSSGYAITKGSEVMCDEFFLDTVSTAGKYLIGWYCPNGTNVVVSTSQAVSA